MNRIHATQRTWFILMACLLAALGGSSSQIAAEELSSNTSPLPKSDRPLRLFILAGQSNAQGYNHIRQYHGGREAFPDALRLQPKILFWPGTDTPSATNSHWITLHVIDSGSFGPEIQFGADMASAMPEETIAIMKYAVGGTGIARSVDYTDYIPAVAGYQDHDRNWSPPQPGRESGIL